MDPSVIPLMSCWTKTSMRPASLGGESCRPGAARPKGTSRRRCVKPSRRRCGPNCSSNPRFRAFRVAALRAIFELAFAACRSPSPTSGRGRGGVTLPRAQRGGKERPPAPPPPGGGGKTPPPPPPEAGEGEGSLLGDAHVPDQGRGFHRDRPAVHRQGVSRKP